MTAYDRNNIFAQILRGEIPCIEVFRDDNTLAFMDIMPRAEGHVLVIPIVPSRNILSAQDDSLAHTICTVKKIANAQIKAFNADGITVNQYNESAGGQVIFHTHFHVIPRFNGVALAAHTGRLADEQKLKQHAEQIVVALNAAP